MKYKFIDKDRILPQACTTFRAVESKPYIYADEELRQREFEKLLVDYKELVIEPIPEYDKETEYLTSWYEDGEVITQKFKVENK